MENNLNPEPKWMTILTLFFALNKSNSETLNSSTTKLQESNTEFIDFNSQKYPKLSEEYKESNITKLSQEDKNARTRN